MAEHTPGPWRRKDIACHDTDGEYCGTEHWVPGPDGEELACPDLPEDADLIASTPDLLRKADLADRLAEDILGADDADWYLPPGLTGLARQILALSAGEPAPQTEGPPG